MRRSGITSRSKCASFSISQMSCSRAGPRGPAVMMLVLSATGAPVALVNRSVLDMVGSLVLDLGLVKVRDFARPPPAAQIFDRKSCGGLPAPGGVADHAAEIAARETRILIREHVGLHIAEGRFGLVLDAVVEGLDDVFLEVRAARVCMD